MSAADHLSDLQFEFTRKGNEPSSASPLQGPLRRRQRTVAPFHQVEAHNAEGAKVGSISWEPHNGRVEGVSVDRDRRRQGIGTRLWYEAHVSAQREGLVHPVHSDVQMPLGKAWAAGMTNRPRGATPRKPKAAPSPDQESLF